MNEKQKVNVERKPDLFLFAVSLKVFSKHVKESEMKQLLKFLDYMLKQCVCMCVA